MAGQFFNKVSLNRIIKRAHFHRGAFGHCSKEISEEHEYLEHLPQIHLPLLELLIHYKGVNYYEGDGGFHPGNVDLIFGTGALDLHPIDVKGLTLFEFKKRDSLTCILNVQNTSQITPLMSELAKLRKDRNFLIQFMASDATLEYDKWDKFYDPIFRNDALFITGIPRMINRIITSIGITAILYWIIKSYNQQWNNYLTHLNACASTIPSNVQAVAGYLSTNQYALWGKSIEASLPKEVKVPPFVGNESSIVLQDIKTAVAAINKLQDVQDTYQPTYLGHGMKGFGLGIIGLISKQFLHWICETFTKPGILKSTLQILGFVEPEYNDIACYMNIVKPKKKV